jgi:hypothetical protein
VEPRRGDQDLPLASGEHGWSDPGGLVGDRLDVRPAVAERAQEALCVAAGPLDKRRHATTIPGRELREVGVEILGLGRPVWDGKPARGIGGTADIVSYARQKGVPVAVLWPEGAARE